MFFRNRCCVFVLLITLLSVSVKSTAWGQDKQASKPNVLLIFTDDQRFDTIGALGNPHIKTPNLDRLVKRSFVFRNAYSFGGNRGAVCIPSRNMLMTGQTYFRFGGNIRSDGKGPTLPKSFKAAGYETYYREKSGRFNLPTIQVQFDHYKDIHMVNALRTGRPARGIVNDAIAFLEEQRDASKPFFMYLGMPCPHDPRWATKRFRDMYDPEKLPLPPNYKPQHPFVIGDMRVRDERLEKWPRTKDAIRRHLHDYYATISSMDHDLGRLFTALDSLSLTGNTLVIFSSDQGIALGSHGLMGKQNIYDDTQRVPLLMAGPGIPAGKESNALVYVHDIFPSLCAMAGTAVPTGIDGKSFSPIVAGKQDSTRHQLMLSYLDSQRSIRDERWKLIRFPQINRTALYDLKKDPHETQDLANAPATKETVARLTAALEAEQKRYGDTLPLVSKNPLPAKFHPPKWTPTPYPPGGLAPKPVEQ